MAADQASNMEEEVTLVPNGMHLRKTRRTPSSVLVDKKFVKIAKLDEELMAPEGKKSLLGDDQAGSRNLHSWKVNEDSPNLDSCKVIQRDLKQDNIVLKDEVSPSKYSIPTSNFEELNRLRGTDKNDPFTFANIAPKPYIVTPTDSYIELAAFIKGAHLRDKARRTKIRTKKVSSKVVQSTGSYKLPRKQPAPDSKLKDRATVQLVDVLKYSKNQAQGAGKVWFQVPGESKKRFVPIAGPCKICKVTVKNPAKHKKMSHNFAFKCKICVDSELFYFQKLDDNFYLHRHCKRFHEFRKDLKNVFKIVNTSKIPRVRRKKGKKCYERVSRRSNCFICGEEIVNLWRHSYSKHSIHCDLCDVYFHFNENKFKEHLLTSHGLPEMDLAFCSIHRERATSFARFANY